MRLSLKDCSEWPVIADDNKKQYLSSESPGGMPELTGGTKLKSKKHLLSGFYHIKNKMKAKI
jgi:hypothetical protein